IQIDMSEFMERHSVARLVGAPPGYVGYDDAGQLTEAVRRRPYSIIVFDEIEKAHPDTFNMLLQMMEEGVLTDARGRKVDFRNTILIMTSNVGASDILKHSTLGFALETMETDEKRTYDDMRQRLLNELRRLFRPEFLNRVDAIIVFRSLNHEDIRKIVGLEFAKLRERMLERGYDITLTEEACDWLAQRGYSSEYGARPLRRLIQQELEVPLSDALLAGEYRLGETIVVDLSEDKDRLAFRPTQEPELVAEM
ncbi:MAG TPA: ATP-dependent Clp protease ATP-binding subunit, partial [Chloroflexi bacterium]|nr:ATP-dependent Clp protease ATP-binding subunit [Chloroflexota bacterium]